MNCHKICDLEISGASRRTLQKMNSRDTIFSRIRKALSDHPQVELPPPPQVWPTGGADVDALARQFDEELSAISGEFFRCGSLAEAQEKIADLVKQLDSKTIAAVDRPLTREAAAALDAVRWTPQDGAAADDAGWTPPAMEKIQLGLIVADYLLADTGSCMVECNTPQERLMCYLPPTCLVVARADRLREHMPAAWKEIASRLAEPDRHGEFVIVTGPSRTADIEKILILGVHGPKRLFVVLIG